MDYRLEDLIYCPKCGSCGEDGCCPPFRCNHGKDCLYPDYQNGLLVRFCRLIMNIFGYKIADYIYNNMLNLPYWFLEKFVCSIIGHRTMGSRVCTRCYSTFTERK